MRIPKRSWLVCLALSAACGDAGSPGPTAPSLPSVTSITVAGNDLLLVGNSETFTAVGNTGALKNPLWGSDAPAVATVDALTGLVTAVAKGTATIFVDANGVRGTMLVRTLPNFGGSWHGVFQETACESSGDFVRWNSCDSYWDLASGPLSLTFTQNRDRVSGRFGSSLEVSGVVSSSGTLSLTGTSRGQWNVELQNVRLELTQNSQLTGTFEEVYSSGTTSFNGTLRMFQELRGMSRSGVQ